MLMQRIRALSLLNVIFKRSFNHRKFYSNCNKLPNNILNDRQFSYNCCGSLTGVDRHLVRFYSNASETIDESKVHDFFNRVTKSVQYEDSKNLDDYLKDFKVTKLLKHRMEILDYLQSLKDLADDKEMKEEAEKEEKVYKEKLKNVESELLERISESVAQDTCHDIIFEISAGVGGQEAMLFAKDLMEMYQNYFNILNFDHEIIEVGESDQGGFRKVIMTVSGPKAMEILRHECGVHRVQRVPATEKSGRIHTSVVSISVLPQPSEIEIVINKEDLKIEKKRSTGAGGQSVNTTDSCVRITHLPTGVAIECQTERSQIQNMKLAMLKLRMKLYQDQLDASISTSSKMRRQQMGLRNRNEKIRTFNYNQNRVTDHRISENGTVHNLRGFLEGEEYLTRFQEKLQKQFEKSVLIDVINETVKK